MQRRQLIRGLLAGLAGGLAFYRNAPAQPARSALLLQMSPVAGFQYHQGESVWSDLTVGSPVTLCREPNNRYDAKAVAVYWQQVSLGYLPRMENTAVSQLLDRHQALLGCIQRLKKDPDPWQRIQLAIYWVKQK